MWYDSNGTLPCIIRVVAPMITLWNDNTSDRARPGSCHSKRSPLRVKISIRSEEVV